MMKKMRKGRIKKVSVKIKRKKDIKWERKEVRMSQQIYTSQKATCVHAFKLWPYTSIEKHSAPWLHPTMLSHALAKPRHSPHILLALLSTTLVARAHTLEECSSSSQQLWYSTPFGTHSHTQKKTYFAPPIIVPMEHATKAQGLCTLAVCVT